jgi:uncharacterized protein (DUF1800 family)
MKNSVKFIFISVFICLGSLVLSSFLSMETPVKPHFKFPYKQAGLTKREAAAHLLNRFTFGATPDQVDEVVKMGLEKWFEAQLNAGLPDDSLAARLSTFDALKLSNTDVVNTYPKPFQVLRMAIKDSLINKDSVNKSDRADYKQKLKTYMELKGLKPEQELMNQFINQKIIRAAYTNNQLQEVLTDFWFNHFNVSIVKNDCEQFIPAYERDVIRPNVAGKFEDLLLATAKSPAMLYYLDNFSSAGTNTPVNKPDTLQLRKKVAAQMPDMDYKQKALLMQKLQKAKVNQGLNENYAREVMELHTLGVDGGYTQKDVTQAALVLTGWTIYPMGDYFNVGGARKLYETVGEDKMKQRGFVHDGDFLFAANRHDNSEKTVLNTTFPANGGYEEGVALLKMLAHHPSTARFISTKLAVHFVSDIPPKSLIDKMAKTFMDKDGDIKQVLITMAESPEFWSRESLREKIKSPFELAISAVRCLHANIGAPVQLNNWVTKMGQKEYYYQAPTGYPDNGQYWINTGSLLNRMNFGLALVLGRIPGVTVDFIALNKYHEPEGAEAALLTYGKLLMPERNLDETEKRLKPLLKDPGLVKKVDEAAGKTGNKQSTMTAVNNNMMEDGNDKLEKKQTYKKNSSNVEAVSLHPVGGSNLALAQVVGILIGSPEFQRK